MMAFLIAAAGLGAAAAAVPAFVLGAVMVNRYDRPPAPAATIDLGVVEGQHRRTDATSADVAAGQRAVTVAAKAER